jgi:hypothetical protein
LSSDLEDAAVMFARAVIGVNDADSASAVAANAYRDCALHDLIVAAGFECPDCDGECPGIILRYAATVPYARAVRAED